MTKLNALLLIFVILVAIMAILKFHSISRRSGAQPTPLLAELKLSARRPLTPFEEKMYFALTAALPECTVLAQVSFQALLDTPNLSSRNRFNRKTADFVVCSQQLTPIAVVELDDTSHTNKKTRDADRDAMLRNAGYQTLRYKRVPTPEQIKADIENVLCEITNTVTSHENPTHRKQHL